jgi:PAS domain S-box-containing protein
MRQSFFGEFEGILLGCVYLEDIFKPLADVRAGQTGFITIINREGTILAHSQKDMIFENISAGETTDGGIIASAMDLKTGYSRNTILGIDGFVAYAPIKDREWSLIVVLPYEEFITSLNTLRNVSLIITLAVLIVGVFVSLTMAVGISRPLSKLAAAADQIRKYDLSQRVDIRSGDEVGKLSYSFNKMADELERAISVRDNEIGERKNAEEQLRKLSLGIEQSPISIIITDADGNIEYVNPKFTEVSGYAFEEVFGENPRILKSGKQPPRFYRGLWDTIKAGKEWRGELQNKHKNGELHWESVSISPIKNSDGKITHYIAFNEEVTHRKKAEKALHRKAFYDQSCFSWTWTALKSSMTVWGI